MNEYIITKKQIEELNKAHGGMEIVTSWLSCYAIWDTSNTYPVMKSEHVAIDLPEIVRCRDCKHYEPERKPTTSINGLWMVKHPNWCNRHATAKVEPDGFCAWGVKRKEDGDD